MTKDPHGFINVILGTSLSGMTAFYVDKIPGPLFWTLVVVSWVLIFREAWVGYSFGISSNKVKWSLETISNKK